MRDQFIQILQSKGFTYHRRETWEPVAVARDRNLSKKPPLQVLANVTRRATHYTSAINLPDGDPGEILDGIDGIRQLLIRSNYDYLRNRSDGGYTSLITGEYFPGYPLGYSWAYDWLGGIWEINGIEFRPSATSMHNTYTKADLMLTDRNDPASQLMMRSVREVGRTLKQLGAVHLENRPWAHGWFKERTGTGTATVCCGYPVKEQINQGLLDLSYDEGERMLGFVARPENIAPRILDTRNGGDAFKLKAQTEANVSVPGAAGAEMVVVNLTTSRQDGAGYITAWGNGPRPNESKINFQPGVNIANEVMIPLNSIGQFKIWSNVSTHVIVDLVGYMKPI